jgi:hypothetical protein
VQELTADDAVLLLLAEHLSALAAALARRGHARSSACGGCIGRSQDDADETLREVVGALSAARGHPDWERGVKGASDDGERGGIAGRGGAAAVAAPARAHRCVDDPAPPAATMRPEPEEVAS